MDAKGPSRARSLERREFLRLAAAVAAGAAFPPMAEAVGIDRPSAATPNWLAVFKWRVASDRGVVIHQCSTDPLAFSIFAHFLSCRTLDKVVADIHDPIGVVFCDPDFADRLWHLGPAGTPIPSELNPSLVYAFAQTANPGYFAFLRKAEIDEAMKLRSFQIGLDL